MATAPLRTSSRHTGNGYPTSDHRPMAETDLHRKLMFRLIEVLTAFYASMKDVYVSGNLLIFYEEGNRRRHVAPDVFVVKGVPKRDRLNYLLWEEGKGLNVAIELTSSTTRAEDTRKKLALYQDVLQVKEYFLFDPKGDYLKPRLQGHRLRGGVYHPIRLLEGRLPSRELGLHLETAGDDLRLFNPATGLWLPTPEEMLFQQQEKLQRQQTELQQLRQELEAIRGRLRSDG